MTVWQVVALLEARRAKVRSEITELQGEGVAVVKGKSETETDGAASGRASCNSGAGHYRSCDI